MAKSKHDVIDSGRQHLGSVYAKALLGAAEKAGQAKQVLEELDSLVTDVLNQLPQLDAAFISPRLAHEEKAALIDKAFWRADVDHAAALSEGRCQARAA
jgi:F-type H+-transporting ATPase subunit delta